MARIRKTIMLEEKIEKAQEAVEKTIARYDAAVKELLVLLDKKDAQRKREPLKAVENSLRTFDQIMPFLKAQKKSMTLSQEGGQLYYRLWLPLLDFVKRKYQINRKLKSIAIAKTLELADVKQIANKLWSDVTIIDDYLNENRSLSYDHREIIRSWKRRIRGKFMMERHLKQGTIFISLENEEVYQVSGIILSWEEMFFGAPMPLILGATFMPFWDAIISDGLVMPFNILVEGGMKRMLMDLSVALRMRFE